MFIQFFIWLYRTFTQAADLYTAASFPYAQVCSVSSAVKVWTVLWLGLLFAGLSPQCRGFSPRPFIGGFTVDTVALIPVPLRVLQILPVSVTPLTFRHRASCILGQAFHYSPENASYIFNQQIYFII